MHNALRSTALLVLSALAAGMTPVAHAGSADGAAVKAVQAPYYGDALFQLWQGDEFGALTSLMAAQQMQRLGVQETDAEILRGRILMKLGMHREAALVFGKLSEQGFTPEARDNAWFELAKLRYQAGEFALAEEALGQMLQPLPGALEEDRGLLKAELLMARADYRGAVGVLKTLVARYPNSPFVRYNLGVAQMKAGFEADGIVTLDALGRDSASTEEERILRDRANVALGFVALKGQQDDGARRFFERLPLQGTESNKALLGYGWAAMDQQAPQSALVPWLTLIKREPLDPAILEAKVAVPYAYERLKANGKAVQQYNEAIQVFERERKGLDASIEFVRSGRLVEALLALNPKSEAGAGWQMDGLPDVPNATYLTTLFAQNEFQQAYKNLRDLRKLDQNLQSWRGRAEQFKGEQAARRQSAASRMPRANALGSESVIANLRKRIEGLEAEVAQIQTKTDLASFADARQREQLARVARVQAIVNKPGNAPDIVRARERLRLVSGLLNWQLMQVQLDRTSEAQKALAGLKDDLAAAQGGAASTAKIIKDQAQRAGQLDERIESATSRLDAMGPQVKALLAEQQNVMQEMALTELQRQKENLSTYLVQARYAVAQLYDQAAANARSQSGNTSRSTGNKDVSDAPKP